MTTIAFDTDGTLIHQDGKKYETPRYEIIQLYKTFESLGYEMFCWSGGGVEYCEHWVNHKLGLNAKVVSKGSFTPDIAIDDEFVKLGKVNLKV